MKLIYTNYGILTEERVRELKECGYDLEECGQSGEMGGEPLRMAHGYHDMDEREPVKVVILGPGQEDVLEEGDTSTPADGSSVAGTQASGAAPHGPSGALSPSGAAVTKEGFNQRAEALLEAWMKEEAEEEYVGFKKLEKSLAHKKGVKDPGALAAAIGRKKYGKEKFQKAAASGKSLGEELTGKQDKLDLDDDGEIEASDLTMLRRGLKDDQVGSDRKR